MEDAYRHFGAHVVKDDEGRVRSVRFTVYAPNARSVSVVGTFNDYAPHAHEMRSLGEGFFRLEIEEDLTGQMYKYLIHTQQGERVYKSDPFAFASARRPDTPSRVTDLETHDWHDKDYMAARKRKRPYEAPISIYEVHPGSWMRKPDGAFHSYTELAERLIGHVKEHGFTHIELMPVYEHPFDGSWGYQGTGYYSITSRYGEPTDFLRFVDACHQEGIGVILDWVPGHIAKDGHGLYRFDGTHLYEYADAAIRENEVWGTANLDLGKGETQSFLISNARFFLEKYHIDGIRVDAVANIIHHLGDPSRGLNEGGIAFLRKLTRSVFAHHEQAILAAEDSTAHPLVTHPVESGGLGFNYKWNMGWMNDTLSYFQREPVHRKHHHDEITFSLMYAFSENFILPFSHDEVVHGKKTLVAKMPGDYWQKFANYRALLGWLYTHPGKKLLFMGQEFAQMDEWKEWSELDWNLLAYPMHEAIRRYVQDLNELLRTEPALHEVDHDPAGFEWIDADNAKQSVLAYLRRDRKQEALVVVLNLTPATHDDFLVGVPEAGTYKEIMNSDKATYGGSGIANPPLATRKRPAHGRKQAVSMRLAPLSVTILKREA